MMKKIAFAITGAIVGSMLVWAMLGLFAPLTSIDDAIGYMLGGLLAGAVAGVWASRVGAR